MKKICTLSLISLFCFPAFCQTIWTGPKMTFTKANNADWTLASNQDRLTANVWLTRADTLGIFNIVTENIYTKFVSPANTEWAFGTTADISTVTFMDWQNAIASDPPGMVNQDMILHLISDDIYIDIKFLSWTIGRNGGGFSYERSTDPTIGLDQNKTNTSISIFPNPSTDVIKILGVSEEAEFTITNMLGQKVLEGSLNKDASIRIENLPTGKYLLSIDQNIISFAKD